MALFGKGKEKFLKQLADEKPISLNSNPADGYSPEENAFWASFVNEFVESQEWHVAVKRLIHYWREIDASAYPIYKPLQSLEDWELAYGTELWVVYDFATTYVEFGEILEIDPSLSAEARVFLAEYFCALARKMDGHDIRGFVEVIKDQIETFGEESIRNQGSAILFQ